MKQLYLLVVALCFGVAAIEAGASPMFLQWNGPDGTHKKTFDLADPEVRSGFLKKFYGKMEGVKECADQAGYALVLMKERDMGKTEKEHLAMLRRRYEASFDDPQGAIAVHVYVDFQRIVRDLHRKHHEEFVYTDPNIVWDREFQFCFIK